jgi:hypothetical protein
MLMRSFKSVIAACLFAIIMALPVHAYIPYDSHVFFLDTVTKDTLKLIPRSMGQYIFQNRYDFGRGMTFTVRDIQFNPLKTKDLEEIRREAYERLMRDIPYCIDALKGGELKLDTNPNNLAGRLGMIAKSVILIKMPDFPDLEYLVKFSMNLDDIITNSLINVWVFYDGYPDFKCLGEVMERLKPEEIPMLRHSKNPDYPVQMKEDPYAQFRAPSKFYRNLILTSEDVNRIYNAQINAIADVFTFIWKCSGMDLAHPSYAAPPGTVISRPRRGMSVIALPPPLTLPPPPEAEVPPLAGSGAPPPPPSSEE